jgi:hypothetical protein
MTNYPTPDTPIKKNRRKQRDLHGKWTDLHAQKGAQPWTEHTPRRHARDTAPLVSAPLYLSLVHHAQGPGEPFHWSLFVDHGNQPGSVYQVKGYTESMAYEAENLINETQAESFSTLYQLAVVSEEQARLVKQVAECEPPPNASIRQFVVENCQGWSVRVIAKLVERNCAACHT